MRKEERQAEVNNKMKDREINLKEKRNKLPVICRWLSTISFST
jgi:hypothetical protein